MSVYFRTHVKYLNIVSCRICFILWSRRMQNSALTQFMSCQLVTSGRCRW